MPVTLIRILGFSYPIRFNLEHFSVPFIFRFPKKDYNYSIQIKSGLRNSHTWPFARKGTMAALKSTPYGISWFHPNVLSPNKTCISQMSSLNKHGIVQGGFPKILQKCCDTSPCFSYRNETSKT